MKKVGYVLRSMGYQFLAAMILGVGFPCYLLSLLIAIIADKAEIVIDECHRRSNHYYKLANNPLL